MEQKKKKVAGAGEERSTEGLLYTDGWKNDSTEMVEVIMMVVVMTETEEEKGREAGRRKEKRGESGNSQKKH